MGLVRILSHQTGSEKSKMAATKPDVIVYRCVHEIELKFQRTNIHCIRLATQLRIGYIYIIIFIIYLINSVGLNNKLIKATQVVVCYPGISNMLIYTNMHQVISNVLTSQA